MDSIRAMQSGRARVFMAMGGNLVSATPDMGVTEQALSKCTLTVQVSTKLNLSHLIHGATISGVIPGFDDFNTRVRQPDGFPLPHPPRDERKLETSTGRAAVCDIRLSSVTASLRLSSALTTFSCPGNATTGLPSATMKALICPSPGVRTSSANSPHGICQRSR